MFQNDNIQWVFKGLYYANRQKTMICQPTLNPYAAFVRSVAKKYFCGHSAVRITKCAHSIVPVKKTADDFLKLSHQCCIVNVS